MRKFKHQEFLFINIINIYHEKYIIPISILWQLLVGVRIKVKRTQMLINNHIVSFVCLHENRPWFQNKQLDHAFFSLFLQAI